MSGIARIGARGARRLGPAARRATRAADDVLPTGGRAGDDAAQAGARAADNAQDGGRSAARWWATRGGAAAGVAGAGGLAYRQQGVWDSQASASKEQARAEQLKNADEDLRDDIVDEWRSDNEDDGGKGPLEKIRDAIPGVDDVQQTVIVIVIAAIIIHVAMNQSSSLPNSPVVVGGET